MNEHTALAISQTLQNSGPQAAERQLTVIGHEAGDDQLALIVQALLPGEVAAIVGEGDYTKPSIASHFVTPEQFLGALERFGARWGRLEGNMRSDLVSQMSQEVADFVFSVILTGDESHRHALVTALLADTLGQDVLILVAVGEVGCPEFLEDDVLDVGKAEKGTWQELFVEIEQIDHRGLLMLKMEILALYSKEFDFGSGKQHPSWHFINRTLKTMSRKAAEHVGQEKPAETKADEVFADV